MNFLHDAGNPYRRYSFYTMKHTDTQDDGDGQIPWYEGTEWVGPIGGYTKDTGSGEYPTSLRRVVAYTARIAVKQMHASSGATWPSWPMRHVN